MYGGRQKVHALRSFLFELGCQKNASTPPLPRQHLALSFSPTQLCRRCYQTLPPGPICKNCVKMIVPSKSVGTVHFYKVNYYIFEITFFINGWKIMCIKIIVWVTNLTEMKFVSLLVIEIFWFTMVASVRYASSVLPLAVWLLTMCQFCIL